MQYLEGNRIDLLESGAAFFPALKAAIGNAEFNIHLETYIFCDDVVGREIANALIFAARRGVAVHVLIDGFGSRDIMNTLVTDMRREGVQVLVYRPERSPLSLSRHRLRRLHRKITVVDGTVAFVGGINIIDDYQSGELESPRLDYAVRIEGPLLQPIHKAVLRMWRLVAWVSRGRRQPKAVIRKNLYQPAGNLPVAFVVRGKLRHRGAIEDAYLELIRNAREEIIIACAYFFPGRRFRVALNRAAMRGVKITLLLQGVSDHPALFYATRALHPTMLTWGIRVFEYHCSELHAKVAVIDRRWATVGSSNIDPFSLLLAREANVFVDDPEFAGRLRDSLQGALAQEGCRELLRQDPVRLPWRERCRCWLAYHFVRATVDLSGARGFHREV